MLQHAASQFGRQVAQRLNKATMYRLQQIRIAAGATPCRQNVDPGPRVGPDGPRRRKAVYHRHLHIEQDTVEFLGRRRDEGGSAIADHGDNGDYQPLPLAGTRPIGYALPMESESPCVGICILEDDICIGCGRSAAEIFQAGVDAGYGQRPEPPAEQQDER